MLYKMPIRYSRMGIFVFKLTLNRFTSNYCSLTRLIVAFGEKLPPPNVPKNSPLELTMPAIIAIDREHLRQFK